MHSFRCSWPLRNNSILTFIDLLLPVENGSTATVLDNCRVCNISEKLFLSSVYSDYIHFTYLKKRLSKLLYRYSVQKLTLLCFPSAFSVSDCNFRLHTTVEGISQGCLFCALKYVYLCVMFVQLLWISSAGGKQKEYNNLIFCNMLNIE